MIHFSTPYDRQKNLGRSYNKAFSLIDEDDWLCVRDIDTMFLTPDAPAIIEAYTERYPEAGIFTCLANRLHSGAYNQLWEGKVSEDRDIGRHIEIAQIARNNTPDVTQLSKHISGMLMVIAKKTWNEIKFSEDGKCLGVDNEYSDRILNGGRSILRMNKIYIFHIYRMISGVKDKSHLL